jgi:hypothetical protein
VGNLVSQADYARRRGCSESMVSKFKEQGRLVIVDGLVDIEESDKLIAETVDPTRGGDRSGSSSGSAAPGSLHEATRRERMAKAERAELELEELRGELVRRRGVDREAFARARVARGELLLVPDLLADGFAAETDREVIRRRLEEEITRVCNKLAEGQPPYSREQLRAWLLEELERVDAELKAPGAGSV